MHYFILCRLLITFILLSTNVSYLSIIITYNVISNGSLPNPRAEPSRRQDCAKHILSNHLVTLLLPVNALNAH